MKTLNYNIVGDTPIKVLNASDIVGDGPTMTISNILATSNSVSLYYTKENYNANTVGDVSSTATITITAFGELNSGDKVNLIATDGTSYNFTNGSQSSVNGTWESTTSNNATATNLMNVINTSSGPSGTRFTATVSGAVVTVTQATKGTAGNTSVTLTDSGTAGMTKTNFTGGENTDVITNETYHVLKSFVMGAYKTLTLDTTDFAFSNKGFDLYVGLGGSGEKVDVIVNI